MIHKVTGPGAFKLHISTRECLLSNQNQSELTVVQLWIRQRDIRDGGFTAFANSVCHLVKKRNQKLTLS